jgi:hypothetical protein
VLHNSTAAVTNTSHVRPAGTSCSRFRPGDARPRSDPADTRGGIPGRRSRPCDAGPSRDAVPATAGAFPSTPGHGRRAFLATRIRRCRRGQRRRPSSRRGTDRPKRCHASLRGVGQGLVTRRAGPEQGGLDVRNAAEARAAATS